MGAARACGTRPRGRRPAPGQPAELGLRRDPRRRGCPHRGRPFPGADGCHPPGRRAGNRRHAHKRAWHVVGELVDRSRQYRHRISRPRRSRWTTGGLGGAPARRPHPDIRRLRPVRVPTALRARRHRTGLRTGDRARSDGGLLPTRGRERSPSPDRSRRVRVRRGAPGQADGHRRDRPSRVRVSLDARGVAGDRRHGAVAPARPHGTLTRRARQPLVARRCHHRWPGARHRSGAPSGRTALHAGAARAAAGPDWNWTSPSI